MLRRHAANCGCACVVKGQGGGKGKGFGLHLRGGFDDDLRVAAGTRCFQMGLGIGGDYPVFRLPSVFRLLLREQGGQMPCLRVDEIIG